MLFFFICYFPLNPYAVSLCSWLVAFRVYVSGLYNMIMSSTNLWWFIWMSWQELSLTVIDPWILGLQALKHAVMLQVQLPTCILCHFLLSPLGLRLVLCNILSFLQHQVSRAWRAQALTVRGHLQAPTSLTEYVRLTTLDKLCLADTPYIPPHRRRPHHSSPIVSLSQPPLTNQAQSWT